MIRKRLKYQNIFILTGTLFIIPLLIAATIIKTNLKEEPKEEPDYAFDEVVKDSLPVVNTATKIINPYLDNSVVISKKFYDYKASEETQVDSIIKHENTYLQNTGIDYTSDTVFEVVAILDGTVTEVKEDDISGNMVEIKHDNGYTSIYKSLSEINVKKGDNVNQGQSLGKSGTTEIDKELGNHLHFEMYENGGVVNPENYLNKEVPLKKEN